MDSSAAHAVGKLKGVLNRAFDVPVTLFVTGSSLGFPCEYNLSAELSRPVEQKQKSRGSRSKSGSHGSLGTRRGSIPFAHKPFEMRESLLERGFSRNRVCDDLDEALKFAEDVLIARVDPDYLLSEEIAFLKGKAPATSR